MSDMADYIRTIERMMLTHVQEHGETVWFRHCAKLYNVDLKQFKEKYSEEILFALLEH